MVPLVVELMVATGSGNMAVHCLGERGTGRMPDRAPIVIHRPRHADATTVRTAPMVAAGGARRADAGLTAVPSDQN